MLSHLAWLKRDVAYSLRQMSRAPAFASAAVASLALAIAVNSTTFSVVTALLLRPVVASDRGDVVRIGRSRNGDSSFRTSSYRDFRYLREHASYPVDCIWRADQATDARRVRRGRDRVWRSGHR